MKWMLPIALLFLASCNTDSETAKKEITVDRLTGMWELQTATRNGKSINTLENAYFQITPEQLSTNWLGQPVDTPYELADGQLKTEFQDIVYTVQKVSGDSLHLMTDFRNFVFTFNLTRKVE